MPDRKVRATDDQQDQELFEHTFAEYTECAQTYWQKADALMNQRHWYSSTFKEKTRLSDREYSRYLLERTKTPSLYAVMAICVGLDIDVQIADDLLATAGYVKGYTPNTIQDRDEHRPFGRRCTGRCAAGYDEGVDSSGEDCRDEAAPMVDQSNGQ